MDKPENPSGDKKTGAQFTCSKKIFAVGIMNRGQIINASMAYECAVSTKEVVKIIINDLMLDK